MIFRCARAAGLAFALCAALSACGGEPPETEDGGRVGGGDAEPSSDAPGGQDVAEDGAASELEDTGDIDGASADASGDLGGERDAELGPIGPCGPIGTPSVYAVYAMNFGVEGPAGQAPGFDIDSTVTTPADPEGCRKPDFIDASGTPGIDNQFARLIPLLINTLGESPDDSLVRAIGEGELILLFELESLDDAVDDECVSVNVFRATRDVDFGTDGQLLAGQTFEIDLDRPWARFEEAEIRDGRLRASGVRLELPLSFFSTDVTITLSEFLIEMELGDDVAGTMGGAISIADLLMTVLQIDPGFAPIATPLLEENADLWPNEAGRCEAISIAWSFSARRGHLYADTARPE